MERYLGQVSGSKVKAVRSISFTAYFSGSLTRDASLSTDSKKMLQEHNWPFFT